MGARAHSNYIPLSISLINLDLPVSDTLGQTCEHLLLDHSLEAPLLSVISDVSR